MNDLLQNWSPKENETRGKLSDEARQILLSCLSPEKNPLSCIRPDKEPPEMDTSTFCHGEGWIPEVKYMDFAWEGVRPEIRKRLLDRISSASPEGGGSLLFFVFSTHWNEAPTRYHFSYDGSLELYHSCDSVNCVRHPSSFWGEKEVKLPRWRQRMLEDALNRFLKTAKECEGGNNSLPVYCETFYSDGRHCVFQGLGCVESLPRQEAERRGEAFTHAVDRFCEQVEAFFHGGGEEKLSYEACLVDPESGHCYELLERINTIGGLSASTIVLHDRYAALFHALILKKEEHCTIKDLGSRNGSFVNGRPLEPDREVTLSDGDEIMLAGMRLIFYDSSETRAGRREQE